MPIRRLPKPTASPDQVRRAADFCLEADDAKRFFEWIAERPPLGEHDYLSAGDVTKALPIDRRSVVEIFKRLSKIELSYWLPGRHSSPTRMWWKCQSAGLGNSVLEELQRRENLSDNSDQDMSRDELIEHSFKLNPDRTLQFRLPKNFTSKDAERVGAWLRTLPFE